VSAVPDLDVLPDQHGATFPTTGSLVAAIRDLRASCVDEEHTLALLAVTVSNASEVVDHHGNASLEPLTAELARRMLAHEHLPVRLLRVSPLGGFLLVVVVRREVAHTQVAHLVSRAQQFVALEDDVVWPVVTTGARLLHDDDDERVAVQDVRATVVRAGTCAVGDILWHRPGVEGETPFDLLLVRDLAHALTHEPEQIALHYQPVLDLRTGELVAVEALLRWTHPELGAMSPAATIEAAERSGLIVMLGRHVLRTALAQLRVWLPVVGPTFRMHVNVSPLELRTSEYVDHLDAALYDHQVPAERVLLEVTETVLVSDEPVVQRSLEGIGHLGVALGIDDFGTGYSSIVHLRRLPIDTVKIDRSLVSGIGSSPADFLLTRSVMQLVSTLSVRIVAEGIESELEAAHLRAMGCRFGQGYHLGRPVPASALLPDTVAARRPASA
jgi:diguanylate cyclase